jgi:hypothetical protein
VECMVLDKGLDGKGKEEKMVPRWDEEKKDV